MIIFRRRFITYVFVAVVALTGATLRADVSEEAEEALKKADSKLNVVYKETLKAITRSDARNNLIQAQRAWIAFRDAEAELRTSLHNKGGIVYAYGRTVEKTELTKQRTQELIALRKSL